MLSARYIILLALLLQPLLLSSQTALEIKTFNHIEKLVAECEQLLLKYPRRDFTPNVMFQLVELYTSRADLEYQQRMQAIEQQERISDTGAFPAEATLPDYSEALAMAHRLLSEFPDLPYEEKLLYRIAICYHEQNDRDKAVIYFDSLTSITNEKSLLEESYFRIGEYYFDSKDYPLAIKQYEALLNSWDSPYYDMALYKLAWSYYNIDDYSQAIATNLALVADINLAEHDAGGQLSDARIDLRDEAIKNIAVSLADFNGTENAKRYLDDKKHDGYPRLILEQLAAIYQERDFYARSNEIFALVLDYYPGSPQAPSYQQAIIENYERLDEHVLANEARWVYIEQYGPGTIWFEETQDLDLVGDVMFTAENYLYNMATEAHQQARAVQDTTTYELAIASYRTYLDKFPDASNSAKVLFYLSEAYYEQADYNSAVDSYSLLMLNHPHSEFQELAAYHRILAIQHLFEADTGADSVYLKLPDFLGTNPSLVDSIRVNNIWQAELLQSLNDFCIYHPESKYTPEVLLNYAGYLHGLRYYGLSEQVYRYTLNCRTCQPYWLRTQLLLAQSKFQQADYTACIEWTSRIIADYPDSLHYLSDVHKLMARAKFLDAERLLATGDTLQAALAFSDIAVTSPDSAIAERALYQSALQFEVLGSSAKAIEQYESIADQFPASDLRIDALMRAAVLAENEEKWQTAARNYQAVAESSPDRDVAALAQFNTARCWELAGDQKQARSVYQTYIAQFDNEPDLLLEAAFRRAEISYKSNDSATARNDLQFVLRRWARYAEQNIATDDYFVANAQFLLAELEFATFSKIKIKAPLQRTIKLKRAHFELVVKAYTETARFKVAEWNTAASYRLGETFEAFAEALLSAPVPKMSDEERLAYEDKLRESILPFKEKALRAYENNIKQAETNSIDNVWIAQSRRRHDALSSELSEEQSKITEKTGI